MCTWGQAASRVLSAWRHSLRRHGDDTLDISRNHSIDWLGNYAREAQSRTNAKASKPLSRSPLLENLTAILTMTSLWPLYQNSTEYICTQVHTCGNSTAYLWMNERTVPAIMLAKFAVVRVTFKQIIGYQARRAHSAIS